MLSLSIILAIMQLVLRQYLPIAIIVPFCVISQNLPFSGHCDQRIRLTFFWQTINQKPDISCAIGYPFC